MIMKNRPDQSPIGPAAAGTLRPSWQRRAGARRIVTGFIPQTRKRATLYGRALYFSSPTRVWPANLQTAGDHGVGAAHWDGGGGSENNVPERTAAVSCGVVRNEAIS